MGFDNSALKQCRKMKFYNISSSHTNKQNLFIFSQLSDFVAGSTILDI